MRDRDAYSYFLILGFGAWILGSYSVEFSLAWTQAQYHFNYSQEFLKRALIGHLFYVLEIPVTVSSVAIFAAIINGLTLVACIQFFRNQLDATGTSVRNAFLLLFAVSPATFMHYGRDFARYDELLVLILVVSIMLVQAERHVLASLSCALAVLIHEIYIFTGLPLLLACWLMERDVEERNEHSLWRALGILAPSAVTLLAVLLYGGAELDTAYSSVADAEEMILHFGILDHIRYTSREYTSLLVYGRLFIAGVYVLPLATIYGRLFNATEDRAERLVLLSPIGVLPLFAIGVDFERWTALLVVNMLLSIAVIGPARIGLHGLLDKKTKSLFFVHLSFSLLGPLPGRGPFPGVTELAGWLTAVFR